MYKLPDKNNIFIPELAQNIAQHLPWSSLVYFTVLPEPGPGVVVLELRRRILSHLRRFLPLEHVDQFLQHLEDADAAITGSFIRQLLSEGEDGAKRFLGSIHNLNIVVDRYRQEPIYTSLHECGFRRVEGRVGAPFRSLAYAFTTFFKEGDVDCEEPAITVTVPEAGVMSVILACHTTADMTFLTATQLISLFPRLLIHNEALIVDTPLDVSPTMEKQESQGLRLAGSNSHWTSPCGVYCPMRWRKTYADPGFARLTWHDKRARPRPPKSSWFFAASNSAVDDEDDGSKSQDPAADLDDLMYRDNLRWRIWDRCYNSHCSNNKLYLERLEYLKP